MKRLLIAMLLVAPVVGVTACQDNSELQDKIDSQQNQIASLQQSIDDLSERLGKNPSAKVESDDSEIDALKARLASLENSKAVKSSPTSDDPVANKGNETEVDANAKVKAMVDKVLADRELERVADREKRREERNKARTERMEGWAKIAEENGLEFDPKDPMGSIRKIMMDPEKRAKAMEVMRSEGRKRRNERIGVDEETGKRLSEIEDNARTRISEQVSNLRETGASGEEIAEEIKRINDEKEIDVERLLTEEQYEAYKKEPAGGLGGMFPGGGDLGRLIPGFGGGGERRR